MEANRHRSLHFLDYNWWRLDDHNAIPSTTLSYKLAMMTNNKWNKGPSPHWHRLTMKRLGDAIASLKIGEVSLKWSYHCKTWVCDCVFYWIGRTELLQGALWIYPTMISNISETLRILTLLLILHFSFNLGANDSRKNYGDSHRRAPPFAPITERAL